MNLRIANRASRFSWIPLSLVVILVITACSSGGMTSSSSPSTTQPKATGTQPPAIAHLAAGPITYVAMGASDAVGVGSNQPGSQGYVPLIAAHLPKGSHLLNLGISGIHVHEALTQELPLALSTSPDLVTIWLVANDFVGGVSYNDYIHDLNTLLGQLRTNTRATLVMP